MKKRSAVLFCHLCSFLVSASLAAQTASRSFEVVTVKPSDQAATDSRIDLENGNRFIARNVTVRAAVKIAYHLNFNADNQVLCATPWFETKPFDIDAKIDEDSVREMAALDPDARFNRVREMLQSALTDRFHLSLHHETRQSRVDSLIAAKTGVRLRPALSGGKSWTGIKTLAPGHIEGREATLDSLANALAKEPEIGGRLVTNGTGLQNRYDFTLLWSPETLTGGQQTGSDPGLFTALREQLGLRIEPVDAPMDVLVVDRVELPDPN